MAGETIATPQAAVDAGGAVDEGLKTDAKPDGAGVQEPKTEAERKWKLKYGKTEREVTEKELIAEAQKGWASDEKFKSAKALEREIKEAVDKGDLEYLIKKMKGKGHLDYAKDVLKAELKKRSMSQEELDAEGDREAIKKLKEERLKLEAEDNERKASARQKHYEEQYDRELSDALKSEKLPANKYLVGRAIKIASEIVDMDLDPDWTLVVREAKRQVQDEMGQLLDEDPSFVGKERAQKISKWLVSQGMTKKDADKEAVKVVKQAGAEPEQKQVDEKEYWEKKRKQWMDSK